MKPTKEMLKEYAAIANKSNHVFVHYSQIIEVRTGFRCDGEET